MEKKKEIMPCPDKSELLQLLQCLLCNKFTPKPGYCSYHKNQANDCTNNKRTSKKPTPRSQKERQKRIQFEMSEENEKYILFRALAEGCSKHCILNKIVDGERKRKKLSNIIPENHNE